MDNLIRNVDNLLGHVGLTLKKRQGKRLRPKYPKVEEVLDDSMKFKKETIRALTRFKNSNPYKGSLQDIQDKFRKLNSELSLIYKMEEPKLLFCKKFIKGSCYLPYGHVIILEQQGKKYGVVTFLHEFRHAMGAIREWHTCKWSINLFRKVFPEAYSKLEPVGHMLMKKNTAKKIKANKDKIIHF